MEEIFNVKEVTQYLHCSESTIRKLIRNRKIPNYRIANRIYFKKDMIDRWIKNQCIQNMEGTDDEK